MTVRRAFLPVLLLVLASALAVGAEDDPLKALRSRDPVARRAALETLLSWTTADLADKRSRLPGVLRKLLRKDPDGPVRGLAAIVLARADGDAAVKPLTLALREERDPAAEQALPRAFAELLPDTARDALSSVAGGDDARAATLAAEALGRVRHVKVRGDLNAILAAPRHWAVTAGACLGLGYQRDASVPPTLLSRLRHPDAAVRTAARESLIRLTGVDHGADPTHWEVWWEEVSDGYELPAAGEGPAPRQKPPVEGTTHEAPRDRPTHARFFGIELRGKQVAFVIDFSQSMWGPRRDAAQRELVAAVKGLPSNHRFSVILFNEKVWWFGEGPLPARPQEKLDLERYLPEQETKSYTNIYDALERALGLLGDGAQAYPDAPGVDEIVLLSDGYPNRGKIKQTDQLLEAVRELNKGRAKIHAVSLGAEPHELLPELAKQNGGKYVARPFPK